MNQADRFDEIGLTPAIRHWLAQNTDDKLRNEIVLLILEIIACDFPKEKVALLRSKIANITAT